MTHFGPPELLTDYGVFGRPQALREALQPSGDPRVFLSPDGQHLLVCVTRQRRLLSFPRLPAAPSSPPQPGEYLEHSWPSQGPALCGVLFPQSPEQPWLVTMVWEGGRAEVWIPPWGSGRSWTPLQAVELCGGPRARLISVCVGGDGSELLWCEERPPSKCPASPSPYCVCRRSLRISGQRATLGTARIVLHHSPLYTMASAISHVFMIPNNARHPILIYVPAEETVTLSTVTAGAIQRKALTEVDYKKLTLEYAGYMARCPLPEIQYSAVTGSGHLLLLTSTCKIYLLYRNGIIRHVYDLEPGLCSPTPVVSKLFCSEARLHGCFTFPGHGNHHSFIGPNAKYPHAKARLDGGQGPVPGLGPVVEDFCPTPIKMEVFGETLAFMAASTLYLIDLNTGRLMDQQLLSSEDAFLLKVCETDDIQLLTKDGVYKIAPVTTSNSEEAGTAESALLETVYEEACKYYQRRSLSSTRLTVQALKKEGMFQAPITLATILNNFLKYGGKPKELSKYADLLKNLTNELQSFASLEILKSGIVNASETEVDKYCNELVDHEISRLLQTDLDRDSLVYINFLFTTFPKSAWISLRNNFQFQQNGDGKLVIRATADLWKKVLSPLSMASKETSQNGVYPMFEVVCQSLCTYKPKWLPGFVLHAQECSGLSWNFTAKENSERGALYKRALSVLNKRKETANVYLEVDILIGSGRPQAIIQAIHTLIRLQCWSRVMEETQQQVQLNPMIRKDVFITLLLEFVKHRHLDSHISELCEICPEDLTATDILQIVLQNIPKPVAEPPPFPSDGGIHLTIGLLKPLLNKALQNQLRREDVSSPTSPPITPHRTTRYIAQNSPVNGDDMSPTDIYATKAL